MSTGNSNVDARCDQNVTYSGMKGGTVHDSIAPPSRHIWSQTFVRVTYLIINESGEGEVVEKIGEKSPDVGISVFPETLVVESVDLGDLP